MGRRSVRETDKEASAKVRGLQFIQSFFSSVSPAYHCNHCLTEFLLTYFSCRSGRLSYQFHHSVASGVPFSTACSTMSLDFTFWTTARACAISTVVTVCAEAETATKQVKRQITNRRLINFLTILLSSSVEWVKKIIRSGVQSLIGIGIGQKDIHYPLRYQVLACFRGICKRQSMEPIPPLL